MHAPVLEQLFTHLVCIPIALSSSENDPPSRTRFSNKTKKYKKRKHKKNEQTVYTTRHSSRYKSNGFTIDLSGQNACFARSSFDTAASLLVSRTPREQRLVVQVVIYLCYRLLRCLVEEEQWYPPGLALGS